MDYLSYLGTDYLCRVEVYGKEYPSVNHAMEALKDRYAGSPDDFQKEQEFIIHELNLCKFRQNPELAVMLMAEKDDNIIATGGYNLLRVKNALLMELVEKGSWEGCTLRAKISVRAGRTIQINIADKTMAYRLSNYKVACACMQMNPEDFKYFKDFDGEIEYEKHLMSEVEFVDALSDIEEVLSDDPELMEYYTKDLVRYYLRDLGNEDAAEALIYCGF